MSQITIPEHLQSRTNSSFYMATYADFYLKQMKVETGKAYGTIIEDLIKQQPNFKEKLNEFLEESKL